MEKIRWNRVIMVAYLLVATIFFALTLIRANKLIGREAEVREATERRLDALELDNVALRGKLNAYIAGRSSQDMEIRNVIEDLEAEITEGQLGCECWGLPPEIKIPKDGM